MSQDQYDRDLMACVHCGLCLSACPTYLATGSEADSPRGRIVMMAAMHRGESPATGADMRRHIDRCLGCRACETACPSGVAYGGLLEVARERVGEHRPPLERAARKALLESLTHPTRLRITLAAVQAAGSMPSAFMKLLSGGDVAGSMPVPYPGAVAELPPIIPPAGARRARVGMLTGCVMRVMYGDVNQDTAHILAANGCEVLVSRAQGCCGALHIHNGEGARGLALARKLIDAFTPCDGLDAIVVNSAGCASTMKEYGELLAGDSRYRDRAARFAARVRDVSEFLDELGWAAPMKPVDAVATYHDACHLAHAQRITEAPRRLIALIPGLSIVKLDESDVCCGSAGIYNLTEPALAGALLSRKVSRIRDTGASILVTGNPGCMAWIATGLAESGIRVVHPATILRMACG